MTEFELIARFFTRPSTRAARWAMGMTVRWSRHRLETSLPSPLTP